MSQIDIDQLLQSTEEIAEESIPYLYPIDIDQLLDNTNDW